MYFSVSATSSSSKGSRQGGDAQAGVRPAPSAQAGEAPRKTAQAAQWLGPQPLLKNSWATRTCTPVRQDALLKDRNSVIQFNFCHHVC